MKITWLGQAGLLFETDGKKIVIDPYLSDNVKNFEPQNYRRVPVDEAFLQIKPDVLIITHNHLDHLDHGEGQHDSHCDDCPSRDRNDPDEHHQSHREPRGEHR